MSRPREGENVRPGRDPKDQGRTRARKPARGAPSIADIVQVLRERIARQDVAPGAKLGEQELAAEFGVPRARIREVFGVLESRGLIERIPNRGAVVSRLELDQVFHLYDVRAVLEGTVRAARHPRTRRPKPGTSSSSCSARRWTAS